VGSVKNGSKTKHRGLQLRPKLTNNEHKTNKAEIRFLPVSDQKQRRKQQKLADVAKELLRQTHLHNAGKIH
jgi:hypothetical protein